MNKAHNMHGRILRERQPRLDLQPGRAVKSVPQAQSKSDLGWWWAGRMPAMRHCTRLAA
jgi:hypothetical protein